MGCGTGKAFRVVSSTGPFRNVNLGPTDIVMDHRPDGTILVRSPHELGGYAEKMTERLDHWARHASYRTFLAERDANGRWRNVTYAEAQYFARRIGQALIHGGAKTVRYFTRPLP